MAKAKQSGAVAKNKNKKEESLVKRVLKRDGTIVPFDVQKITDAVHKGMKAAEEGSYEEAELIAMRVYADLIRITKRYKNFTPSVEGIQDTVEKELILGDYVKTSKAYILYREERARLRENRVSIPEETRKLFDESKKYFKNQLGEFLFYRSYARWIPEQGRRETWIETVDRYVDFMKENLGNKLTAKEYAEVREAILKQEVMPSMRLMQFAGDAARKTNVCAYNCSYIAPETFRDFAEVMYISMCGTGCGWSVESQNIQKLPQIKMQTGKKLPTHVIPDDKEGWCDALLLGMKTWAEGNDIAFDYSQLRPAGARLKTMGGKASGPEPLRRLLDFTREKMLARQGRRLRNIDAHDILCMIGNCVVSGGVRRSAMISLSDLDDELIRDAKKGQFWNTEPQRSLANNSAVYERKPSAAEFMEEWLALMKSGSGERGIFNRGSLAKQLPKRRLAQYEGKEEKPQYGTNPCGEIILESKEFCNLSEVICRGDDTPASLMRKTRVATILGTYQSTLTHFPYLSKKWKENCERERLLGVSLTGQWDCDAVRDPEVLKKLKKESVAVNKKYAKRFGIPESTAITCTKPSGTVSKTFDTAAGMHPRHAKYYIQRIRISATDSLFKMLKSQKVPFHPEVGQSIESATTFVLEFPMKSPNGAIFKNDLSAIDQLEHWKMVKENYTEHNPSATISVGEDEWIPVANWLYENWEIIGGLSFLPRNDYVYHLAPYEEITEERYNELAKNVPDIDFSNLIAFELQDETDRKQELACVAGNCEVV